MLDISNLKLLFIKFFLVFSQTEVLGELQFAFLCFLVGQNYDCFEQWKLIGKWT